MVTTKWLAALSTRPYSTIVVEGTPPFAEIAGELSPWQKLLKHLDVNDLHITGMRIQVTKDDEAVRTYNLPSHAVTIAGLHPKWQHIRPAIPIGYGYRRCVRNSLTTDEYRRDIEVYAGYDIGGTIYLLSLFVDEREGTESWTSLHVPDKVPVLV